MPNIKSFHFNLIVLFFLIAGMNACRSHKKTTASDVDLDLPSPSETAFYTSCYPIESLYVPSCKLEISTGGNSFSLNGSIYIRSDSVCYFRGRWMLIEAMRGAIYRDSFVVVSYLERKCYKGKNDYLQKITGYPVNPETMMLLFTADRCEEAYRNINRQQQPLFSVAYSDYKPYPQFVLPTVFDISAHDGTNPIRIKANFQQILLNQPQVVNIPSNYEVVVLE